MSAERSEYDVVVVGAGPAGSSAALTLARKGVKVLLLEKARNPGENNVSGGVLYGDFTKGYGLIDLVPGFETQAPLERKVLSHEVNILSSPDLARGTYHRYRLHGDSVLARLGLFTVEIQTGHDHTVVRADFDRWLAEKAVAAGAELRSSTSVQGLATNSRQTEDEEELEIIGVRIGGGEIHSKLVIDCAGVTSTLVEEAGLRGPLSPRQLYHSIKHVYRLPSDEIEKRLDLGKGEGVAINCFGDFMQGVSGSAFVFTNKETLSVGVAASVDSMVRAFTERFDQVGSLHDVLAAFEAHPFTAELLAGAEPLESLAHNIPKGYLAMLKRPFATGYLPAGDALGAFIKIGPLFDGMRRAIASGIMAAETYLLASETGSFRASNLSRYKDKLSPLYEDANRSGRESFFGESGFAYTTLPKILFSSSLFSRNVKFERPSAGPRRAPTAPELGGESARITVDLDAASKSSVKPWVPTCPAGCFTLVTNKGRFTSYKELYAVNLKAAGASGHAGGSGLGVVAYRETAKDMLEGALSFDVTRCVACATCAAIGPKTLVAFAPPERADGMIARFG